VRRSEVISKTDYFHTNFSIFTKDLNYDTQKSQVQIWASPQLFTKTQLGPKIKTPTFLRRSWKLTPKT